MSGRVVVALMTRAHRAYGCFRGARRALIIFVDYSRAAAAPCAFNLSAFSGATPSITRSIASRPRASPPSSPSPIFYTVESARILSANSRPLCGLALRPVALRTDSR